MEEPSTMGVDAPSAWNFLIAIYFAFSFVVARYLLDRFVFRRLACWLLNNGVTPLKINVAMQAKIAKCAESMWKLTYYGTVEICILTIGYNEPWFTDTKQYFKGWPNQELNNGYEEFAYKTGCCAVNSFSLRVKLDCLGQFNL
ncbi:hypothetical protein CRG98_046109 [Punica granatum]|uniref:Uncharacterized protein n=1 Tax=Punica granatum TaxID=22663 RepID=A0A2I0HPQ5_PUNGR|nr:hypothetical protein CRG98_046109 [Punica granatum]